MPQQNHSPKALYTIYHVYARRSSMKRKAMRRAKDKRVYTQTANSVKKINVKPKLSRGGIRL